MAGATKKATKSKKIDKKMGYEEIIEQQRKEEVVFSYEKEGKAFMLTVTPSIPFFERIKLVNAVVSTVFMDDKDVNITTKLHERYAPYLQKIAFRANVLSFYTDIELPTSILVNDAGEASNTLWSLVTETDIYDKVAEIIGEDLLDIELEIEEMIRLRCRDMVKNTEIREFLGKLSLGLDKLTSIIDGFSDKIGDIDVGQLTNLLGNLSGITESDILKDVIENLGDVEVKNTQEGKKEEKNNKD